MNLVGQQDVTVTSYKKAAVIMFSRTYEASNTVAAEQP